MKKARSSINRPTVIILASLAILAAVISTRGLAASLNQKNLALTSEVSELVSTNQWIKYQISDKISLDKIESYAKQNLQMVEAPNEQILTLDVDMNKINSSGTAEDRTGWLEMIQKNIGDIFDGQGQ